MYQLTSGTAYRIARAVARNVDIVNESVMNPTLFAANHGHRERRWISFEARVLNDYGIGPTCIFASVMANKIIELLESQNGAVVRYRSQNLFEDSIDAEYTVSEWRNA